MGGGGKKEKRNWGRGERFACIVGKKGEWNRKKKKKKIERKKTKLVLFICLFCLV